jgi:transcriptional regulator with XRE-family HTH domain
LEDDLTTLGKRIRSIRSRKNLSLAKLADAIDISQSSLSNIENDKQKPTSDVIIALSEYFEVTTDWLLKGVKAAQDNNDLFTALINEYILKEQIDSGGQLDIQKALLKLQHVVKMKDELDRKYKEFQDSYSVIFQYDVKTEKTQNNTEASEES